MTKIAVVYHSGYGHTQVLAESVAKGAEEATGTDVTLISVDDMDLSKPEGPHWQSLDEADAIIFGSPTYMGSVSGPFKMFMDATSGRWMKQGWQNKIAAGFTNSGSYSGDKLNTLFQMIVFAAQHGMTWINPADASTGNQEDDVNRIGSYVGVMAQSKNAPPEVTPPAGDHESGRRLGKRVAEMTQQFQRGSEALKAA